MSGAIALCIPEGKDLEIRPGRLVKGIPVVTVSEQLS
jgi:hypothetical protein